MKKNISMPLILLIVFLTSCNQSKIFTWESMGTIHFENKNDTTRFSFAYLNTTESIIETPLILAGQYANYVREIEVAVIDNARNPNTKYEIIRPITLEANADTAWLKLKVYKTPNLDLERDTISIRILSSSSLLAGDKDYLLHTFTFYNHIEEPTWWRIPYQGEYYFGEFSETKMKIINEVFGTTEYYPFDSEMLNQQYPNSSGAEYQYRVYKFKNYVAENYPEIEWGIAYDWL